MNEQQHREHQEKIEDATRDLLYALGKYPFSLGQTNEQDLHYRGFHIIVSWKVERDDPINAAICGNSEAIGDLVYENEEIKRRLERLEKHPHLARLECECSGDAGTYVPCATPATKVVEWRHQDGDRERRAVCGEHAREQQRYWSEMDWDTGVEVSDIEDWQLGISYGGGR